MCSCPACKRQKRSRRRREKNTQHVCPAGDGRCDYVIDIGWIGWRPLGSASPVFLASYSDVIRGCIHTHCVYMCVSVSLCVGMHNYTRRQTWPQEPSHLYNVCCSQWWKVTNYICLHLFVISVRISILLSFKRQLWYSLNSDFQDFEFWD